MVDNSMLVVGERWLGADNSNISDKYDQLLVDILSYMNTRYDLNILIYNITDKSKTMQAFASGKAKKQNKKIVYGIEITHFQKKGYLNEISFTAKDVKIFIESLGIIDDDKKALAVYLFNILHEIGHIERWHRYENNLPKINNLDVTIESLNRVFHDSKKKTLMEKQKYYSETQTEANADTFAYRHFYLLWKEFNLDNF